MALDIPKPPAPRSAARHVIADYRHSLRTVTCVCGWAGSTASSDGQPSAWSTHVIGNRTLQSRPSR